MTSTDVFDEFRRLIQISIVEHADKYIRVPNEFVLRLNRLIDEIVPETRRNVQMIGDNFNERNEFLKGLITKIENIETGFYKTKDGKLSYFCLDDSQSFDLKIDGTIQEKFAFHIHRVIKSVKKHYNSFKLDPIKEQEIDPFSEQEAFEQKNSNTNKINEVYGFKIRNEYNLNPSWLLLRKSKFIDISITFEAFKRIFTRKKITNRVIWTGSEKSLHYFIEGIYGKLGGNGIGLEKEDAHWKKASDFFIKKDGSSYKSENLSRTKPPKKSDIDKLNPIITQMNKVRKGKN